MNPLVSVLMSVYNGDPYLHEAIESIINQTFTDFEFIIINDGSTDKTSRIIKEYLQKDSRIVLIEQENMGLTKSLNKGIYYSKGKYIARQDVDDISLPNRLSKQIDFLENNNNIVMVGSYSYLFEENKKIIHSNNSIATNSIDLKKKLPHENQFNHGSVLFHKRTIKNIGGYREQFKYCQDYDLWLRVIHNYDVSNMTSYLYKQRLNLQSISFQKFEQQNQFKRLAQKYYYQRIRNDFDDLDKGDLEEIQNVINIQYDNNVIIKANYYFQIGVIMLAMNRKKKARHNFILSIKMRLKVKTVIFWSISFLSARIINLIGNTVRRYRSYIIMKEAT